MKKFGLILILFIVAVLSFALVSAQEKREKVYELKYNLKENTVFSLRNTYTGKVCDEKDGKVTLTRFTYSGFELNYRVLPQEKSKENFFEAEYKNRFRWSESPDKDTEIIDFSNMFGGKIKYRLSEKGDVSGLEGFEELPKVTMSNGKNWPFRQLQAEIRHLFPSLPDKPVKIGDTWKSTFESDTNIEFKLLEELKKDGIDCVKFAAYSVSEGVSEGKDNAGNTIYYDYNFKLTDIYYFAYKKGMLLSKVSTGRYVTRTLDGKNKKLLQTDLSDVIYETYVCFK